jgi:hypothetical protein
MFSETNTPPTSPGMVSIIVLRYDPEEGLACVPM